MNCLCFNAIFVIFVKVAYRNHLITQDYLLLDYLKSWHFYGRILLRAFAIPHSRCDRVNLYVITITAAAINEGFDSLDATTKLIMIYFY